MPPSIEDDECCTCCCDDSGQYVPAIPLGFDNEQKTFDTLKEIIDAAIKTKTYKCWHIGTKLVETYTDEHSPIEEFDVIYLFSKSWETPKFPVLVKEIKKDTIVIEFLGGEDDEEAITHEFPYKTE